MKTLITCACTLLASVAFTQINSGLIAFYKMNGNANDSSGNMHHAIDSGAILTVDRFSRADHAFTFDGGNFLSVAPHNDFEPGTGAMSVAVWFSQCVDSTNGTLVSWYRCGAATPCTGSDGARYDLSILASGRLEARIRGDAGWEVVVETVDSSYDDCQWHHVVMGFDVTNDTVLLYVDGVFDSSGGAPFTSITSGPWNIPLQIGRTFVDTWAQPFRYFHGDMDDVRIYNRLISPLEVDSLYNEPAPTPPTAINGPEALSVSVHPNPVQGVLTVQSPDIIESIELRNLQGRLYYASESNDKTHSLDVASVPAGQYMIRVKTAHGVASERVVVLP